MLFETKDLPMNEDRTNIVAAVILTAIVVGGISYMVYVSNKKTNSITITKNNENERTG